MREKDGKGKGQTPDNRIYSQLSVLKTQGYSLDTYTHVHLEVLCLIELVSG